ncbi:iron chelate uptake ABC transporter family permease subunit, partial [Rhodococcus hoagii]|nr:iron chelate uptake ABC transporter family permease subunit [Prescottella equi]
MLEIQPTPAVVETPATRERAGSGAFATVRERRRYWAVVSGLAVLAVAFAFGVLAWDNPLPVGSPGFWRVAELRATSLVVIAIVVICQAMATVAFQSATNNRIITPSIMGFEALYVAVQTASVFFLVPAGVVALQGV